MNIVVMTVPHAKCDFIADVDVGYEGHSCDSIAEQEANKLLNELLKLNIEVYEQVGNISRYNLDLNRIESRLSEYHRTLDRFIDSHLKDKVVLLDIHSGDFGYSPIVIFDFKSAMDDILIKFIVDQIGKDLVTIKYGPDRDYIIKKLHELKIPAVLIEFNENKYKKNISIYNGHG